MRRYRSGRSIFELRRARASAVQLVLPTGWLATARWTVRRSSADLRRGPVRGEVDPDVPLHLADEGVDERSAGRLDVERGVVRQRQHATRRLGGAAAVGDVV